MAPKKKDAKKGPAVDDNLGEQQATAFVKKGYPGACEAHGVVPLVLSLDRGEEGTAPFGHLAVHAGISADPKSAAAGPCTPQHIRPLLEALAPYGFLKRLAFWSVAVKDEGMSALATYLVSNKTVTSLDVTDIGIGPTGCKALGEALERNSTLTSLRLDHNRGIQIAGVAALGESLTRNVGLSVLSLTFCCLDGEEAADAIISGCMRAPALRCLELKGNRFGEHGAVALLRALKVCPSLFRIDLSDIGFGMHPEVHQAIDECFLENTVCHEYCLAHNHVGDTCVYRWLKFVREQPHLIFVDVTNQCDPLLYKQIYDAADKNKKDWVKRQKKKGKGGKGKGKKKK